MRRVLAAVVVYAGALGFFFAAHAAVSPTLQEPLAPPVQAPAQAGEQVVLAARPEASYNWAGYVARGAARYTAVSATWVVPHVLHPGGEGVAAEATWVGIGGVEGRDLIQAGTQALVGEDGGVLYQAWWETLPAPSVPLPLEVRPGDTISASVSYLGQHLWHIAVFNDTTRERAELVVPYLSSFSSAEWVEEMPSLAIEALAAEEPAPEGVGYTRRSSKPFIPLAQFDTVAFVRGAAVADGAAVALEETGAEPLRMITFVGETLAAPTVISAGGFSVLRSGVRASALAPEPRESLLQPL